MSACEKCWKDSGGSSDRYQELLAVNRCSDEEQAGEYARECPHCGRMTLHQHTGQPMCGCPRSPREAIAGHTSAPQSTEAKGGKHD